MKTYTASALIAVVAQAYTDAQLLNMIEYELVTGPDAHLSGSMNLLNLSEASDIVDRQFALAREVSEFRDYKIQEEYDALESDLLNLSDFDDISARINAKKNA